MTRNQLSFYKQELLVKAAACESEKNSTNSNLIESDQILPSYMTILVTGGAGFIGSNFVLNWLAASDEPVINLDKLTYAGNRQNLASLEKDDRHRFIQGDIGNFGLVSSLL